MTVKGELKKSEVTEEVVQAYRGGGNCPVMGLFRAGMIQRGKNIGSGPGEVYDIQLAYDKSIYEGSPQGIKPVVRAYGLVAVKPAPPGDVCSHPTASDVSNVYDRRVPCKAHDYCYDLIRFTVAPGLSEKDCDDKFHDLMNSDCADRDIYYKNECLHGAEQWTQWVRPFKISHEVHPGVVVIQNVETSMCVDVEGGSEEDGARLIQWQCKEHNGHISNNRLFRFYQHWLEDNWYFRIQPEHKPYYCLSVATNHSIVLRNSIFCQTIIPSNLPLSGIRFGTYYPRVPSSILFVLKPAENGEEQYTIQSSDSSNRCWVPETSDEGSRLVNTSPCNRDNDLHLWRIVENKRGGR